MRKYLGGPYAMSKRVPIIIAVVVVAIVGSAPGSG